MMVTNANPFVLLACFIILLLTLLLFERKRLSFGTVLFSIFASLYFTFVLTVTILGRSEGTESSWDRLLSIYSRAIGGEQAAQFDILYNIVLYFPIGLLISHYKQNNIVIIALFAIPVTIELCQLITTRGLFEISDIINNFLGGLIGLGIARLTAKLYNIIKDRIVKRKGGQVERAE